MGINIFKIKMCLKLFSVAAKIKFEDAGNYLAIMPDMMFILNATIIVL
jgi:hypothetical protein